MVGFITHSKTVLTSLLSFMYFLQSKKDSSVYAKESQKEDQDILQSKKDSSLYAEESLKIQETYIDLFVNE